MSIFKKLFGEEDYNTQKFLSFENIKIPENVENNEKLLQNRQDFTK